MNFDEETDMQRRDFMVAAGAATLASVGAAAPGLARAAAQAEPTASATPPAGDPATFDDKGVRSHPALYQPTSGVIAPARLRTDRIARITVCTRPFRAKGPRIELEKIAGKNVIHNYGHGGSGWSLSWGSGMAAAGLVRQTGVREAAVVGCGAIGLTTAVVLQRQGIKARIYTRERAPDVRSFNATGVWTPDSRVGTQEEADGALWEELCRNSFRMYQAIMGLPGNPVEWIDSYTCSDLPFDQMQRHAPPAPGQKVVHFANFSDRVRDLTPAPEELPAGTHPFPVAHVRRGSTMMYNIPAYMNWLEHEFLLNGGQIEYIDLRGPEDFRRIKQKTIVNATGYGARALLGDDSIIPVRGQVAHMVPQHEVDYALYYNGVGLTPRRDGLLIQAGSSEMDGWNNPSVVPNRKESEQAVLKLAAFYAKLGR